VSYGGLIAAAFAARHAERVSSLVLVSAMPPSWKPDARARFYLRAPTLLAPLFVLNSLRMCPEIAAAYPGAGAGLLPAVRHAWRVLTHPASPVRMARRIRLLERLQLEPELAGVAAPVLIVTGEATLDRAVPVEATREYLRIWPHARSATLERTGHLGPITRADAFADLIVPFIEEAAASAGSRRRIG
jgi:pimeloyl-ACP methyl ester carboxylesterase